MPSRARSAPARRPRCPHAPLCVGCPWIGTPYGAQLRRKEQALRDALADEPALAHAATPDEPRGASRPLGYRNHAKLVFRSRRGHRAGARTVTLGVYRPGTHSVLPADECAVHHPLLRPVLVSLRREVERLGIATFDERSRVGALRYALARASSQARTVHLTLVSAEPEPRGLRELVKTLRAEHGERLQAMFLCVNPTPGNTLLTADVRRLFGPPILLERLGDAILASRPDAFLQANAEMAGQIYATAARWLAPAASDVVLDLYCGVGALALHVAPHCRAVLGIEASAAAVACARDNARRLRQTNARFEAGAAEDLGAIATAAGVDRIDAAMVNPPRKGLTTAALDALLRLQPHRLLYVSCDPRTFARDLARLAERGYVLRRVRAFDMLPQTPHVEVVGLLERVGSV